MIYVHIPFCRSFCTYCGFYSETSECYGRYVDALLKEIEYRKQEIRETMDVNTLYIGGGTPSVLPSYLFVKLVRALKRAAGVRRFDEFTVEVNPDDIARGLWYKSEYPEVMKKWGVTRVSIGIQSLKNPILRWMNRRHDEDNALRALDTFLHSGIDDISIDLMFGLPAVRREGGRFAGRYTPLLSDYAWRKTLREIGFWCRSGNVHVSAYQLSVEPGSALEKMIEDGRCRELSDEACECQYNILCEEMANLGYNHYEISNFAKPGHEARHNSAYWRHVPYVGLGPGAHSLEALPDGGRRRSWNKPDLALYLDTYAPGSGHRRNFVAKLEALRGSETLSPEQIALENVMLGLRTSDGCLLSELEETCDRQALRKAVAAGHLVPVGGWEAAGNPELPEPYYRIPEKYFFISDNIISDLVVNVF